ncbi:MAG: UDP-N-acetylmuramate dehydrogenase [Flavobacteriaceae bacterium]|nr:UDP-N-acetylmuramate dehydrogenase [Flavobacteriaceae bacterium]
MGLIQRDVSLKRYNSFGIEHKASFFSMIENPSELPKIIQQNKTNGVIILGGGSNILLTNDLEDKLVIYMANKGIEIVAKNKKNVELEVQGGEKWHDLVLWSLERNFGGLENLALIPGQVGAAPIQNIGAYGVELKRVFLSCKAYDLKNHRIVKFDKEDCRFEYRNSIFKAEKKNRFVILSVRLILNLLPYHQIECSYGSIKSELNNQDPTIHSVAKAVIAIRSRKLPDPEKIGNAGSFFKNPVVPEQKFLELSSKYPKIPFYDDPRGIKIPAAWLIEKAGLKGYKKQDAGVHRNQALVLVNYGNASGREILELAQKIKQKIHDLFGISLKEEVQVL